MTESVLNGLFILKKEQLLHQWENLSWFKLRERKITLIEVIKKNILIESTNREYKIKQKKKLYAIDPNMSIRFDCILPLLA